MATAKRGLHDPRWLTRSTLGMTLFVLLMSSRAVAAQTLPAQPQELTPQVRKFIGHMVRAHGFDQQDLRSLFEQAHRNEEVVRAISMPATSRPWYKFKPLVVDAAQVADGLRFWNENADVLERAQRDFGVPESVIVALIGIESRYGTHTGGFGVVDSLYTLGFDSHKRTDYFRSELEQFLVLARDQGWDPGQIHSSFAGALGWPQFMPSSYRRFAIDYSNDGKIDLWTDASDIVGSVANYLHEFGWKEGQPIATPARIEISDRKRVLELGFRPQLSLSQWRKRGVQSPPGTVQTLPASLLALELPDGLEYWFGFHNFYVLLRYNYSRNYAMAVYQLAEEIRQSRELIALSSFD
jgi:membrane-bound lytic murein transglycosylase B